MRASSLLLLSGTLSLSWSVSVPAFAQGAPPTVPQPQPAAPPAAVQPQPAAPPATAPAVAPAAPQPAASPPYPSPAPSPYAGAPPPTQYAPQAVAQPPAQYVLVPIAPGAVAPQANAYAAPPQAISLKREPESEDEEDPPHRGFFSRFTVGLGIGHIGKGDLRPKPGFKPIYGLDHTSSVLSVAGQLGGGFENFALAFELLYEQMLERVKNPSVVGFHVVAVGLTASYYMPHDFFVTGHLRWVGLILNKPDCSCFWDQLDSTAGPGVGLTLGKEWFWRRGDDEEHRGTRRHSSIGLALQGNYARFEYVPQLEYMSGLVLLTLSHF